MNSNKLTSLYDIYDYQYKPAWWENTTLWLTIMSVIIVLIGGFVIWYFWFRKKLSSAERAIAQLQLLSIENYAQKKQYAQYYQQLTEIFKRYLATRYGSYILSYTDDELYTGIENLTIPEKQDLEKLLKRAQQAKFARTASSAEAMTKDRDCLVTVITYFMRMEQQERENI